MACSPDAGQFTVSRLRRATEIVTVSPGPAGPLGYPMYETVELVSLAAAAALLALSDSPRATPLARRAAASSSAPTRAAAFAGPPSMGTSPTTTSAPTTNPAQDQKDLFLTAAKPACDERYSARGRVHGRHGERQHDRVTTKRAGTAETGVHRRSPVRQTGECGRASGVTRIFDTAPRPEARLLRTARSLESVSVDNGQVVQRPMRPARSPRMSGTTSIG